MQYPNFSQEFKDKFDQLVKESKSILITSHKNPDDDAIGSTLSTYYVLTNKYPNKKIRMEFSGPIKSRWSYFENFGNIKSGNDIANNIQNFDLAIFLDGSQISRFTEEPGKLNNAQAKTVCIDHHSSSPDPFTLSLIVLQASSTSELIYQLFSADYKKIPIRLAETLLLGIIGDTGSFQFVKPSQSHVMSIAQKLIEDGNIEIQELTSKYATYSLQVFKIIRELLNNAKIYEIDGWPSFTLTYIDRNSIHKNNYSYLDVSDAAAVYKNIFPNTITGVTWSTMFRPKENGEISMSLRSLPKSVNVRFIAEQMGIGGGHDRAAGATFKNQQGKILDSEECIKEFLKWLKKNQPVFS